VFRRIWKEITKLSQKIEKIPHKNNLVSIFQKYWKIEKNVPHLKRLLFDTLLLKHFSSGKTSGDTTLKIGHPILSSFRICMTRINRGRTILQTYLSCDDHVQRYCTQRLFQNGGQRAAEPQ
jgi:hypothetical protein